MGTTPKKSRVMQVHQLDQTRGSTLSYFCYILFLLSGPRCTLTASCPISDLAKIILHSRMSCVFPPDFTAEKWCQDYFLDHSALKKAEAIRSELTDTLNRIELPISESFFGTKTNTHNIKRALLAGFFMQVRGD